MMVNPILSPTGGQGVSGQRRQLAPRLLDLRGKTVGLLVNGKANSALFLAELGTLLKAEGVVRLVVRTKPQATMPAPLELVKEMAVECDAVVTAMGDCGSCSAAAVSDALAVEDAGVPAAVICSDAFTVTVDAMAAVERAPGYAYATTAHPVANLSPEQVRERARDVLASVVSLVTVGMGSAA